MAAAPNTGMEKAEMKALLTKAKTEPVNCAIGAAAEGGLAMLIMHKIKQPKALEKDLLRLDPGAKNTRWGTVGIDPDIDPKLVRFMLNKPVSGMARRLAKTLKGTGFSKVELVLEDGSAIESASDEAEQQAGADASASEPPAADFEALRKELAELIGRIARLPDAARTGLAKAAGDANAALKAEDAAAARAAMDQIRAGLDAPTSAPTDVPATTAGAVTYAKSRLAWLGTRKKVAGEVDRLVDSVAKQYDDPALADIVRKRVRLRLEAALQEFDDTLADTLDDAGNEADPAKRQVLVKEAQTIIARYQSYIASEPLFATMDANPFASIAVSKTMTATLQALSAAIR